MVIIFLEVLIRYICKENSICKAASFVNDVMIRMIDCPANIEAIQNISKQNRGELRTNKGMTNL